MFRSCSLREVRSWVQPSVSRLPMSCVPLSWQAGGRLGSEAAMLLTQNGLGMRGIANAARFCREVSLLRVGRGLPFPGH